MDRNSNRHGAYRIITPKKLIKAFCRITGGKYETSFRHDDIGQEIHVNGFEKRGSFVKQIVYEEDFDSIVAVVEASDSCIQEVKASCYHSILSTYSYFTDRWNVPIPFWAGGAVGKYCKCGVENSCTNMGECNCDNNDNALRSDDGTYTNKSYLPITSVRVGETGGPTEYKKLTIGELKCYGSE